jgi:aldehyde dehydrogenase (NAD+)
MLEHRAHFINGQWQPSNGPDRIAVVNAATEEVMGSIPAGNAVDADMAVRAALPPHYCEGAVHTGGVSTFHRL